MLESTLRISGGTWKEFLEELLKNSWRNTRCVAEESPKKLLEVLRRNSWGNQEKKILKELRNNSKEIPGGSLEELRTICCMKLRGIAEKNTGGITGKATKKFTKLDKILENLQRKFLKNSEGIPRETWDMFLEELRRHF